MKFVVNNRMWSIGDKGAIDVGFGIADKTEENTIACFTQDCPINPTEFTAYNKNKKKLLTIYTSGVIVEW